MTHAVGVLAAYHVTLTLSQGAEKHMTSRGGQRKRPPRDKTIRSRKFSRPDCLEREEEREDDDHDHSHEDLKREADLHIIHEGVLAR